MARRREYGAPAGALHGVLRAVTHASDPRDALDQLADAVCRELGVPACLVFERDDQLDALIGLAGGDHTTVRLSGSEGLREALLGAEPSPVGADLVVPFGIGASADGCLVLREAAHLADAGLALAQDAADLAALAVERLQAARLRAEQQARVDSLLHAGRSITSSLVLQDVLDAVAREVVDALGAGYCVIWEYDEDQDVMVERAGFESRPHVHGRRRRSSSSRSVRSEREILFSREPVIETLSDPWLDAQSRESMESWGEKTCLSLPLRFGGSPLGRPRRVRDGARALLHGGGAAVGAGTRQSGVRGRAQRARLPRPRGAHTTSSRSARRRERLLNELGLELSSSLDPRTVLDSACRRICELLEATGGEIWARRDEQQVECLASWANGRLVEEWVGRRYPLDHWAASSLAMDSGETVAIVSLDDPRLGADGAATSWQEWDQRALLAVAHARAGPHPRHGRDHAGGPGARLHRRRAGDRRGLRAHDGAGRGQRHCCSSARPDHAQRLKSLLEAGRRSRPRSTSRTSCAALVQRPPPRRWAARRRSSSSTTPRPTR